METKTQQPSGTVPVRTALFTGVVFAVAMLLLNGSAMLRSARNLEAGTLQYRICVACTQPLDALSRALRLDSLRSGVEGFQERVLDPDAAAAAAKAAAPAPVNTESDAAFDELEDWDFGDLSDFIPQ